jgi:hypothetical protein
MEFSWCYSFPFPYPFINLEGFGVGPLLVNRCVDSIKGTSIKKINIKTKQTNPPACAWKKYND